MPGIIDGRHWLRARAEHLQGLLDADPDPDERPMMELELAQVRDELRRHHGLFRGWGRRRRTDL